MIPQNLVVSRFNLAAKLVHGIVTDLNYFKLLSIRLIMSLTFRMIATLIFFYACKKNNPVFCTIDVNLSELEYLAGHLNPSECRRLVAALHYMTFELPESIAGAERKLDENIPCLRLLLHWNSSPGEGRGQTHEDIEHRLRQLNRNDLADWLGKTTFKELGRDLGRALNHPFGEQGTQDTDAP
ncbi:uncharacterized protein LOC125500142 [Athalia rosae]|uniref:uncharacterized protein LOC125500142 n=1 Tax=Athalia rosae TaxID=37344 RepID=UPI002033FDC4|nr:uncharacterized protein LOC125500142 [Athalia rosae]